MDLGPIDPAARGARRKRRRRPRGTKPLRILTLALGAALLGGCSLLTPLPQKATLDARLKRFPTQNLPVSAPVTAIPAAAYSASASPRPHP